MHHKNVPKNLLFWYVLSWMKYNTFNEELVELPFFCVCLMIEIQTTQQSFLSPPSNFILHKTMLSGGKSNTYSSSNLTRNRDLKMWGHCHSLCFTSVQAFLWARASHVWGQGDRTRGFTWMAFWGDSAPCHDTIGTAQGTGLSFWIKNEPSLLSLLDSSGTL